MKSILTTVVIVLVLVPATLYAGAAAEGEVTIDFNFGVAEGTMWLARSSKNDVEIIGCSSKGGLNTQGVNTRWAWCRARDASGLEVFCLTEDENLLDALQAISPFSYIRFEFINATQDDGVWVAECTRFDFSTQSLHLPEFATKGKKAKK